MQDLVYIWGGYKAVYIVPAIVAFPRIIPTDVLKVMSINIQEVVVLVNIDRFLIDFSSSFN
jgi:hypothetical protein